MTRISASSDRSKVVFTPAEGNRMVGRSHKASVGIILFYFYFYFGKMVVF